MKRTFTRNPYMTLRRLLILVLVFSMAAGLFAGCKQQEENNDPVTPPGLVTGEETKPSTEPAENPTDATEPDGTAPVELEENFAVITADQVNVRAAPSAEATVIDQLFNGDVVEIEDQQTLFGVTWVKIIDSGWICLDLISLPGGFVEPTEPEETTGNPEDPQETTPEETQPQTGNGNKDAIGKGVITASELNIRSKASTDGDIVGKLHTGDRVEILERSGSWGRIDKGWISLDYVYMDGTAGKNPAKGVVLGDKLNIRSGPGTNYAIAGSLKGGTKVTILTQIKIGDITWACIDKGWISMEFVDMD